MLVWLLTLKQTCMINLQHPALSITQVSEQVKTHSTLGQLNCLRKYTQAVGRKSSFLTQPIRRGALISECDRRSGREREQNIVAQISFPWLNPESFLCLGLTFDKSQCVHAIFTVFFNSFLFDQLKWYIWTNFC